METPVKATAASAPDRSNETTSAGITWSDYTKSRRIFKRRWESIWKLPVVSDMFELTKDRIDAPANVLDVGATERLWKPTVEANWPKTAYKSLDIDRTYQHDYYAFEQIDTQFDLVLCFEVLEHLPAREQIAFIKQCKAACRKKGYLLFSVPNLMGDTFWQDFSHQTALSFWDLPALLNYCGLDVVAGARIYRTTLKRKLLHWLVFYPLYRIINKDFCQSILMLAQVPG